MKKILFLIIICLFLTGCTVNYNLEINDTTFKESITGNVLNSELNTNDSSSINNYLFLLNGDQPSFYKNDNIFYNKETNNTQDGINFEYTYTFNENNFNNSRIINECFDNHIYNYVDNKYYLVVSGKFNCNYSDITNINITTNYNVTSNNATKIKNNTYTWTIDETNKDDLYFFITIDKSTNSKLDLSWNTFKTIGLILIILLSGICIYFAKKDKQY